MPRVALRADTAIGLHTILAHTTIEARLRLTFIDLMLAVGAHKASPAVAGI